MDYDGKEGLETTIWDVQLVMQRTELAAKNIERIRKTHPTCEVLQEGQPGLSCEATMSVLVSHVISPVEATIDGVYDQVVEILETLQKHITPEELLHCFTCLHQTCQLVCPLLQRTDSLCIHAPAATLRDDRNQHQISHLCTKLVSDAIQRVETIPPDVLEQVAVESVLLCWDAIESRDPLKSEEAEVQLMAAIHGGSGKSIDMTVEFINGLVERKVEGCMLALCCAQHNRLGHASEEGIRFLPTEILELIKCLLMRDKRVRVEACRR